MSNAHPVDVHVGRRLRLRRTILGLSQEAIGTAIGVTFQQVQKYERGINRMSASRLHDFSKILKITVGYFFDGYGDDFEDVMMADGTGMAEGESSAFEHNPISNRETMDVMRAYYRIKSPGTRKRILDLIKAVADDKDTAKN